MSELEDTKREISRTNARIKQLSEEILLKKSILSSEIGSGKLKVAMYEKEKLQYEKYQKQLENFLKSCVIEGVAKKLEGSLDFASEREREYANLVKEKKQILSSHLEELQKYHSVLLDQIRPLELKHPRIKTEILTEKKEIILQSIATQKSNFINNILTQEISFGSWASIILYNSLWGFLIFLIFSFSYSFG